MKRFLSNPVNLILGAIILALLLYLIFGEKGLIQRVKLEVELKKIKKEIETIQNENAILREKIHKLETDPTQVEKIAREKYGMAKEGEEIFIIKEK